MANTTYSIEQLSIPDSQRVIITCKAKKKTSSGKFPGLLPGNCRVVTDGRSNLPEQVRRKRLRQRQRQRKSAPDRTVMPARTVRLRSNPNLGSKLLEVG
jgi:hypothetical protein